MLIVLDASAAVEIVLNKEKAGLLMSRLSEAETLMAPELYISEVTNVFWQYFTYKSLPVDICETALNRAIELIDNFTAVKELYREAFSLSCQMKNSVYDSLYLVLARRNNALLLTMDKKLNQIARQILVKF